MNTTKQSKTQRDNYYYKLTLSDLQDLHERGLLPKEELDHIVFLSRKRKRGKFASVYQVPLNKAGTIHVQNIHFYGGENFGEPHYFLGEIVNSTSNSEFSRFMRANNIPWRTFTY